MKTKDLIAALQAADPSGEIEVCVGNHDIHFVSVEPAYYDGCFQVLKRDESKTDCWNVTGAEIRSSGWKLVLHPMSIEDLLTDMPDVEVTFDGSHSRRNYANKVERWRAEAREPT